MRPWIRPIRIATSRGERSAPSAGRPILSSAPSPVSVNQTSATHPIHPRRNRTDARWSLEAGNQAVGAASRSYEPDVAPRLVRGVGCYREPVHRCRGSADQPGHISSASSRKRTPLTFSELAYSRQAGARSWQHGSARPRIHRRSSGGLPIGILPAPIEPGVEATISHAISSNGLKGKKVCSRTSQPPWPVSCWW